MTTLTMVSTEECAGMSTHKKKEKKDFLRKIKIEGICG